MIALRITPRSKRGTPTGADAEVSGEAEEAEKKGGHSAHSAVPLTIEREGEIELRPVMHLTLSADHRVVAGWDTPI